jgi:hypothetical protein
MDPFPRFSHIKIAVCTCTQWNPTRTGSWRPGRAWRRAARGMASALLATAVLATASPPSLETLAYYYGTDKSHDDHKYTDLYASLFDPIRQSVRNITEIGLAQGQSLQVWHDYFSGARIWGIDIVPAVVKGVRKIFGADSQRVQAFLANSKNAKAVGQLNFAPSSMDIIIDDGDHFPPAMEKTLLTMWPYLRVGGFYIVEDVATGANRNGQRYGARNKESGRPSLRSEPCSMVPLGDRRSPPRCRSVLLPARLRTADPQRIVRVGADAPAVARARRVLCGHARGPPRPEPADPVPWLVDEGSGQPRLSRARHPQAREAAHTRGLDGALRAAGDVEGRRAPTARLGARSAARGRDLKRQAYRCGAPPLSVRSARRLRSVHIRVFSSA